MHRHILSTLLAAACMLAVVAPASAFVMVRDSNKTPVRWPGSSVSVWFDPNLSSADRSVLDAAIVAWNRTPANIAINRYYASSATSWDNGRNEIRWIANKADIGVRPAVCFWTFENGYITEADLVFAADWGFTTSNNKADLNAYSGTARSLLGVALHELGHFVGLAHEDDVYNIMGTDANHVHVNGWKATFYVGEDATRGVGHIYGEITRHDVGVSHWRWVGSTSDGYSMHGRTRIADAAGSPLTQYSVDSEPYYILDRGVSYRLQSTLENLGSADETVEMRYVLSTNDTITTGDTTLRSLSVSIGADVPSTYSAATFTIPTSTAPGEYWIGVVLDPANLLAEASESNNATYVAKVRVQ